MLRHRSESVHVGEARAIKKLHKASFRWIECNMSQSLVFRRSFISHAQNRYITWQNHSLYDGDRPRQCEKIADRCERIFKVVQEPKTKTEVEFAQGLN